MEPDIEPVYKKRKYLSVSTLVSFARCPRKYFYEKSGLRSHGVQLAPEYGKCMHEGVPVALETEDLGQAMDAFLGGWVEIEEELEQLGAMSDAKHNRKCAERSLQHFIFTHSGHKSIYKLVDPPEGALPLDNKTSRYEVPWAIDIGLRLPLAGRMDSFCVHRDTGEPWVWELKTASRLGTNFFDAHEMYIQNLTYSLVGQTLNVPVAGVIVEGMLKDKNKVDNQCQMIPVQQHHLEDVLGWLQRTGRALLNAEDLFILKTMKEAGKPESAFPKDFTGCTPYTHFYMPWFRCNYADLCRVPDYRSLTDLYRVVPDHDFLQMTVDPDATRTAKTS